MLRITTKSRTVRSKKKVEIGYELDATENEFDDIVIAYRGTTPEEDNSRISWTIYKRVAEDTFDRGRLFKVRIPKKDILIYFCHNEDEGEIVANVLSDYEIIK